jgi:hypothetical protein
MPRRVTPPTFPLPTSSFPDPPMDLEGVLKLIEKELRLVGGYTDTSVRELQSIGEARLREAETRGVPGAEKLLFDVYQVPDGYRMHIYRDFLSYPASAEEFQEAFGRPPEQDDLERLNCQHIGEPGHTFCGYCQKCGVPRWECGCDTVDFRYDPTKRNTSPPHDPQNKDDT